MPAWVKLIEINTERHGQYVRGVNPVELFTGKCGCAHHGVIVRRGAAVCEICNGSGDGTRKYLSDKTIEAFVGNHHGGDIVSPAPAAERPECESI